MSPRPAPILFLLFGAAALVAGVSMGLVRVGWLVPVAVDLPLHFHAPLMVSGFLGTLIGLERAVGLGKRWVLAAPALTGAGALALVGGLPAPWPQACMAGGSLALAAALGGLAYRHRGLATGTLAAAALLWTLGNELWASGFPVERLIWCWASFLVLTIAAERLELARFLAPTIAARAAFVFAAFAAGAGGAVAIWVPAAGERLLGAGTFSLAVWLFAKDMARKSLRMAGLPRFMAVCLLGGYSWLALAGSAMFFHAPMEPGFARDGTIHSLFLGFVFSMIFAHAPIIIPAVLGRPIAFRGRFYSHVALLHASLLLRLGSDLFSIGPGRRWGALLNAAAILVFLLNTMTSVERR